MVSASPSSRVSTASVVLLRVPLSFPAGLPLFPGSKGISGIASVLHFQLSARIPARSSRLAAVCCSSASERCPRTSASSRVRVSSCFFNSLSELALLLTRAFAFVPVERSLRARVRQFAPLRDKGHLVGTVTGPPPPLRPSPLADRPR